MKKLLFIISIACFSISLQAQHTQTYTSTVSLSQENGQGLEGTVTLFYAFANCFGDAVIAYGYKDLNISAYYYKGKRYTEADLGIQFTYSKYVQTSSISRMEVSIRLNGGYVDTKVLTTTLPKFDTGCFGQTKKIGSSIEHGIDNWQATFSNVKVTATYSLVTKIENYEASINNQNQYNRLLSDAYNATTDEEKINLLQEAKQYANPEQKNSIDNSIESLRDKISMSKENKEGGDDTTTKSSNQATENESTEENNENSDSQIVNNSVYRSTDLSSEKVKAVTTVLATAGIMATQASRFGMGVDYNLGSNFESYAPVLYFMFDQHNGMNISYGIDTQGPLNFDSTRDAFDVRLGYVYDFDKQIDALGFGIDLMYAQFKENNVREAPSFSTYKEGSQINLGLSAHIWFFKLGYSIPISATGFEERLVDGETIDVEGSGIFTVGLYFYF